MQRSQDTFSFKLFFYFNPKIVINPSGFLEGFWCVSPLFFGNITLKYINQALLKPTKFRSRVKPQLEDTSTTGAGQRSVCWAAFHSPLSNTCTWSSVQHPSSPGNTQRTAAKSGFKSEHASARAVTSACHHTNSPKAEASFHSPPLIVILHQHYLISSYYRAKCCIISSVPEASSDLSPH